MIIVSFVIVYQICKRLHMVRFRGRDITSFRPADVHLGAYFMCDTLCMLGEAPVRGLIEGLSPWRDVMCDKQ